MLLRCYPAQMASVEKVKFYSMPDDDGFPLTFALVWVGNDYDAREVLFTEAARIVQATGWYPVVTGHRVFHHQRALRDRFEEGMRRAMNRRAIERLPGLGLLEGFESLSQGESTSIWVRTSVYDLVLDTGMRPEDLRSDFLRPGKRKWLFLSHSHRDHAGNLSTFLADRRFTIAASPLALEICLERLARFENLALDDLADHVWRRLTPMWYRADYRFADGSSVTPIANFHCPGSMAFLFTFADGERLLFSGDLNVDSAYLGVATSFRIPDGPIQHVLLDAAIVGRKVGDERRSGRDDLTDVVTATLVESKTAIVLCPAEDYGVLAFLHLYDRLVSRKGRVLDSVVIVDPWILDQLAAIEWRLKRKRVGELDDAFGAFLKRRATVAESVRVYDAGRALERNLTGLRQLGKAITLILDESRWNDPVFLTDSILDSLVAHCRLIRLGRSATRPLKSERREPPETVELDSFQWLLHSTEGALARFIIQNSDRFGAVWLFHNYPKRLRSFIGRIEATGYSGSLQALAPARRL